MKILCVIDNLGAGGAQRQMVELALGFKEKGCEVEFLTYYYRAFYNSVLEREAINIICIQEPNYIKRIFRMRRLIRKGRYNAVLSFLEASNFICQFAGLPNRKWSLVVGERSANPEILHSFRRMIYRWFHLLADYVVANSHTNMEYVKRINTLLPQAKCRVVYNMVDFDVFSPYLQSNSHSNGTFKLVVPARIRTEKNIKRLIEALLLLNPQERQKLKIYWYGLYRNEEQTNELLREALVLIKKSHLESTLSFHEATHEINTVMLEADAVGLFSTYEGFPNAICEAMACAKPVICSNVSDMKSFLAHSPKLVCDPMSPDSIKESLIHLINMDKSELDALGKQNRTIAIQNFDKSDIVSNYLQLLGAEVERC